MTKHVMLSNTIQYCYCIWLCCLTLYGKAENWKLYNYIRTAWPLWSMCCRSDLGRVHQGWVTHTMSMQCQLTCALNEGPSIRRRACFASESCSARRAVEFSLSFFKEETILVWVKMGQTRPFNENNNNYYRRTRALLYQARISGMSCSRWWGKPLASNGSYHCCFTLVSSRGMAEHRARLYHWSSGRMNSWQLAVPWVVCSNLFIRPPMTRYAEFMIVYILFF